MLTVSSNCNSGQMIVSCGDTVHDFLDMGTWENNRAKIVNVGRLICSYSF